MVCTFRSIIEFMNEILNCSIVSSEIVQAINLFKNNNASGADGMIVVMYQNGLKAIVPL